MDEIITIDLFGDQFKFKPDHQVENPGKVVQHLKKYIKEAEVQIPGNQLTQKTKLVILLLAAMNLAKDFQELKVNQNRAERSIELRLSSTAEKIDKGIKLL